MPKPVLTDLAWKSRYKTTQMACSNLALASIHPKHPSGTESWRKLINVHQVVAPETAHHWPSDTRVSAASCLSDISPVSSPASTVNVIASEQVGLSPVACSSEPAEAVPACTPSVTRSFTLVSTQTSSGTVTCASTVTPTSEPLRKVRVMLKL